MFIMRLDDAAPKRNIVNWDRMEELLDRYGVKPLVGVIPKCEDPDFENLPVDGDFWTKRVHDWEKKGWIMALHGYRHKFLTQEAGLNPVNRRSEFAGVPLEQQKKMIREGISVFQSNGINPKVFFAPAHTFDENTIRALKEETDIRIISDTPANQSYQRWGMTFVPQQSGRVRNLPFKTVTFCYHPNTMKDDDFDQLEKFLQTHVFGNFPLDKSQRKLSIYDRILMNLYYRKHNR